MESARTHLMLRSLTRLRHHNPNSLRFFFSLCCFCFVCSVDDDDDDDGEEEEAQRMWKSMRTALTRWLSEVLPNECYWYAESQLYVSHNHSEYFIDISDHSDRFTDSLFFRSLRWIDVHKQQQQHTHNTPPSTTISVHPFKQIREHWVCNWSIAAYTRMIDSEWEHYRKLREIFFSLFLLFLICFPGLETNFFLAIKSKRKNKQKKSFLCKVFGFSCVKQELW